MFAATAVASVIAGGWVGGWVGAPGGCLGGSLVEASTVGVCACRALWGLGFAGFCCLLVVRASLSPFPGAYKQYAVKPSDRALLRICVPDTDSNRARVFGSNVLPLEPRAPWEVFSGHPQHGGS